MSAGIATQSSITDGIEKAIATLLAAEGYDIVLAEFIPRGKILRLYIEKIAEGQGVTLDDCAHVARWVSDLLDAEGLADGIAGQYTLEVSSPGLDRPLVKPKDFQRFVGRTVQVTTRQPQNGRRNYRGDLVVANDEGVQLKVDGKLYNMAYAAIERARLVPEF